jgi:hemoglobin-like flavoprotein
MAPLPLASQHKVKDDLQANGPGVRTLQVALIQRTWKVVETLPAETVGVLLFKHIFERAPEAAALFSFGRVEGFDPAADHSKNPAVVKHSVTVVKTVGVAVGMLKDLPNLVPVLKDLGARHAKYGVLAAHYPIVGGAFLNTLQVGLGKAYTPEVAACFTAMWGVVESVMLSVPDKAN